MSRNRPYTDFPRNEQGLVDNFIGTAYDTVKKVYDNLPEIQRLDGVLEQIPELAQITVDAALAEVMPPIRQELAGYVGAAKDQADLAEQSAEAAAQSALEAAKVSRMFPFTYASSQLVYDVTTISGDPTATTAGLALWVEGAIEYDFTILSGTTFSLNEPSSYPENAQMRIIINARFDDLVKNFDELQDSFEEAFQEFLDNSGFEIPVPYAAGIVLVRPTQTVSYLGRDYRVKLAYLPLTTTTWAADSPKFVLVGEGTLRQELTDTTNPLLGAATIGRGVVSIDSISDLSLAKQESSLRFQVRGWYAGSDLGGDIFRWDATKSRALHDGAFTISPSVPVVGNQVGQSLSEKATNFLNGVGDTSPTALGCFVRITGYVTPEQFGAIRGVTEITVSASGNQVSKTGDVFTSADVGKKIQIFKAGTANTSHASFIDSITPDGKGVLRTPVGTAVTDLPAHVGFCSYFQLRKMVDFVEAKGISLVHASGKYLMASNNGNILLGQQLNLSADKVDWNFKGSTFFGMLLLIRLTAGTVYSVKKAHLYGHEVVCLGDGLDGLVGNTNWNAVAAASVDSSIYNFSARMIGGCRGLSLQTSSSSALIQNTQVYDFTLTADPVYGQTCDAIDVSTSVIGGVNGVSVYRGKTYNFGKIVGVSNATVDLVNKDVSIRSIEAFGPCRKVGNIRRTNGVTLVDFLVHEFTEEALLIDTCDNVQILGGGSVCIGQSAAALHVYDARVTKNPNCNIRVSGYKGSSTGGKFSQGTLIHAAHGLHVTDCDLDDGAFGIYDSGFSGTIENVRFRGNTANIRSVSGSLLTFNGCFKLDSSLKPALLDESGIPLNGIGLFDGTGTVGTAMTVRRGHNIASITKVATGTWDVTQIRAGAGIPIITGCGRSFGGNIGFVAYGGAPGANAITVRIVLVSASTGALVDSDYISVFIR